MDKGWAIPGSRLDSPLPPVNQPSDYSIIFERIQSRASLVEELTIFPNLSVLGTHIDLFLSWNRQDDFYVSQRQRLSTIQSS
jgi:hypothetical protein